MLQPSLKVPGECWRSIAVQASTHQSHCGRARMSTRVHQLIPERLSIGIWCLSFPRPPLGSTQIDGSLECTTLPRLKLEQALCGAATDLGDFIGGTTSPLQQFQGSAIIHGERIIGAEQEAVTPYQVEQIAECGRMV